MYIVPSRRKSGGTTYTYYNLVEGVRTEKGPRHRVVLSLGKLENIPPDRIKLLGRLIDQRLSGQVRLLPPEAEDETLKAEADRIAGLVVQKRAEEASQSAPTTVNLDTVAASEAVELGPEYVGVEMWRRLHLDEILSECGLSARQRTLAMIEVVGRLVNPASERATSRWVERTALGDLLGEKLDFVNKDALYRTSDRLWRNRGHIERRLAEREGELFAVGETMLLYDLTSTFFEGEADANEKAARGYSRDKRGDCKQVVVGMVLDEAGFPKASEVWEGNTHDAVTMEEMLERLEGRMRHDAGATVVMDRGIATKQNVAILRERGYHYIVALASQSREPWVEQIREATFEQLDPRHPEISACRVEHEGEAFLLVRSTDRREKDRAIRERFLERLEAELRTLSERVSAGKVSADEARTRIGRLRQQYQRASRFVHTEVLEDSDGLRLALSRDEAALATAELLDGLYILKTDRQELDKARLWSLYMMLQDVERSFRHLKTSLGLRPVYHQQTHRCDGHVFISVLAYHLLHAVERTAQSQGDHRSWPTLASELETHRALTVEVDDVDGQRHHLRLATTPTPEQKQIYRSLGLNPKPLRPRRYVVAPESSHENEHPTSTTQ